MLWVAFTVLVCWSGACLSQQDKSQLPQPPVMTQMPDKVVYFKHKETVMMPCKGHGSQPLTFTWEKDEDKFEPRSHNTRMVQLSREGTIVINFPEDKDEGFYQCFASNKYGVAMSSVVKLQPGRFDEFKHKDKQTWNVRMGEKLRLPCTPPTSMPKPGVAWVIMRKNTKQEDVKTDKHLTVDRDGNLLFLNVMKGDDAGGDPYRCFVINKFMRENRLSEEHFITISGDRPVERPVSPMFHSQLEITALLGEEASMKCVFGGYPTPIIKWRKPGSHITERQQRRSFGMELVILNVHKSDEGNYECKAGNTAGTKFGARSFILKVESKPMWEKKPKDVEKGVGSRVSFTCSGRGEPTPLINVWVNAEHITKNPGKAKIDTGVQGNLSYVNIVYENLVKEDTKVLQCNVTNRNGFVYTNFILSILEDPPRFVQPPSDVVTVAENQQVVLFCRTSGKPDPIISWRKRGRPMTGGRYRIQRNGDLLIKRAALSDAGLYNCTAKNKLGSVTGSGRLIVRRQTRLVQRPLDVQVREGRPAKFTCAGTTDPLELTNLKILWFKDDLRVMPDSQRMTTNIQDHSLTITDTIPRDSGRFMCVATNGIDNVTASAMLTVKGRPSKPSHMHYPKGECVNKRVKLLWTAGSDNNAPINKYIVEYNTSFTPDLWVVARTTKYNTVTLPLSPGTSYRFRVRAMNKIGQSEPSKPTGVCETADAPPDMNPENVRTIEDEKNYLIIEWTPMPEIQHNAKQGFSYHIMYKKSTESSWEQDDISDFKKSRMVKKVDGNPYEQYDIQVMAKNSAPGSGPAPTMVIGHSGESEPTLVPVNLEFIDKMANFGLTSTTATVMWDPVTPLESNMKGEFRGFKVQYWKQDSKRTTFREKIVLKSRFRDNCPQGKMCTTLTRLIPFTYMRAQVVVINNFYMGPPSNMISFTTKEGLPGPVKSLRALVAGPNHFKLKWEHPDPEDRHGIIINYDIAFQTVDALVLGKLKDRDSPALPTDNTATLSGLLPQQRYRVHIWPVTQKGRGEDHYIEFNTTAAGAPEAPKFVVESVGEHMMNISWREYATSGGHTGSIFYVEYRKNGLSEWQKSPDEMVKYWANISSLESGTKYDVRVVTTNGVDFIPSSISKVTTSGVGAVYVPTANWFIGMMVIIFILIAVIIAIIVLVKYFHFTFDCFTKDEKTTKPMSMTHSSVPWGQRTETTYPPQAGYHNDEYKDDEYRDDDSIHKDMDMDEGYKMRPPSYTDYDRYSDVEVEREPNKFDEQGTPRVEIRDPVRRQQSYDDEKRRRDDYDDRLDRDDDYDDDDYDREPRSAHTPSRSDAPSSFV